MTELFATVALFAIMARVVHAVRTLAVETHEPAPQHRRRLRLADEFNARYR
jgi:hypothetical protein